MKKGKIALIVITIIEIVVIIICLAFNNNAKNRLNNYKVLDNSNSLHGAIKEPSQTAVILNATLNGSPTKDDLHYLSDMFGIPDENLIYVEYKHQIYEKETDSDGNNIYSWNTKSSQKYFSTEVYIYDDIKISPLNMYNIKNLESCYYYPNRDEGSHQVGSERYEIFYITNSDTISCVADVGDDTFIIKTLENNNCNIVVNGSMKDLEKATSTRTAIIISIAIYIFVFAIMFRLFKIKSNI